MGDNLFSELKKGGFLMLPYDIVKLLGITSACVLSQIIAEHNFAKKNKLNFNDDYLFSPSRMSEYLCMGQEDLQKIFDELEVFGFIDVFDSGIQDTLYIRIYPKAIVNFKHSIEQEQLPVSWDLGLKRSQNPIHKACNFCETVAWIKEYLDQYMAEPEQILMVDYSYADAVIKDFEERHNVRVFDNLNFSTSIDMIVKSLAPRELFHIFIKKFQNI